MDRWPVYDEYDLRPWNAYQRAIADAPKPLFKAGDIPTWRPVDAQWFIDIVSAEEEAYEREMAARGPHPWMLERRSAFANSDLILVSEPQNGEKA